MRRNWRNKETGFSKWLLIRWSLAWQLNSGRDGSDLGKQFPGRERNATQLFKKYKHHRDTEKFQNIFLSSFFKTWSKKLKEQKPNYLLTLCILQEMEYSTGGTTGLRESSKNFSFFRYTIEKLRCSSIVVLEV